MFLCSLFLFCREKILASSIFLVQSSSDFPSHQKLGFNFVLNPNYPQPLLCSNLVYREKEEAARKVACERKRHTELLAILPEFEWRGKLR